MVFFKYTKTRRRNEIKCSYSLVHGEPKIKYDSFDSCKTNPLSVLDINEVNPLLFTVIFYSFSFLFGETMLGPIPLIYFGCLAIWAVRKPICRVIFYAIKRLCRRM